MSQRTDLLVWMDLEMTGLDMMRDRITEIATIITDTNLAIVAEGPDIVIHHEQSFLDALPEKQKDFLAKQGIIPEILASTKSTKDAEQETLAFIESYVAPQSSPLCGNTIHMDRRFISLQMPRIDQYLHYRIIDVSTIKELARRWKPKVFEGVIKKETHRAKDDILESIAELKWYREMLIRAN